MSKDRLGSLLFFLVGVLAFIQSVQFPMGTMEKPGPGVFPLVLSVLLAGIGVLLLFSERGRGKLNWPRLIREKGTVWKIIILSAAFIAAFEGLGYLAASAGYLFLLFFWVCRFRAGERSHREMVPGRASPEGQQDPGGSPVPALRDRRGDLPHHDRGAEALQRRPGEAKIAGHV